MNKFKFFLGVAALVVVLAGCGKGDPPPPLPQPAPPPQTVPGTPIGVVPVGGNCGGVVGGQPFSQTPFYANLYGQSYGGATGNSLQLSLGYQSFVNGTAYTQNVLGSALVNLPDLQYLMGGNGGFQGGTQPLQTQFCVSSTPPQGGQAWPGIYAPADRSVAITMYGIVQAPLYTYNPFDPYSGQYPGQFPTQTTQLPVTLSIGQSAYGGCGAYLMDGRVWGCVEIRLGNQGQILRYQAQ